MKFNYGKIFLLGFGFFGVSVIWGVYNLVAFLLMIGVHRGEAVTATTPIPAAPSGLEG